ncbi:MAG: insulinase family protein [Christensenellaceae bacterium]|nr:insulinase family protein [Christensenellaceae bacterium]
MDVILRELAGGIRFAGIRNSLTRAVSIGIFVRNGSVDEGKGESGLSHFLEHMNFKGTNRRDARKISVDMDDIGAQINAYTSKEITCFYVSVIDSHLKEAVDCLADIFICSVYPEDELEREKNVVIEELAMAEDTPDDVANETVTSLYFKGTPLEKRILGDRETIRNVSREDLLAFRNSHYRPDNIVISAAGNFDVDTITDLLNGAFAKLRHDSCLRTGFDYSGWAPSCGIETVKKEIEQAHIEIALPGIPFLNDMKYAVAVVSNAFGGCMSSRLFQKVREEMGLAYSVYSFASSYRGAGIFQIYANTSGENSIRVTEVILSEIERLKNGGLEEDEIRRSIEQMKGEFILSSESSYAVMSLMGRNMLLKGMPVTPDMVLEKIGGIGAKDVADAVAGIFGPGTVDLVYVGSDTARFEERFGK